jgi:uncharacterized iron-regulated membrane protein
MMRRWHRWISVFFGIFLVWIAATGVLSHVGEWVNHAANERAAPAAIPAGFFCPDTMVCRPKPQPGAWNLGLLHHLHSGEAVGGEVGEIVSFLSGIALLFFAASGLWMYVQMYRRRGRVADTKQLRGNRFFWR